MLLRGERYLLICYLHDIETPLSFLTFLFCFLFPVCGEKVCEVITSLSYLIIFSFFVTVSVLWWLHKKYTPPWSFYLHLFKIYPGPNFFIYRTTFSHHFHSWLILLEYILIFEYLDQYSHCKYTISHSSLKTLTTKKLCVGFTSLIPLHCNTSLSSSSSPFTLGGKNICKYEDNDDGRWKNYW